MKGKCDLCGRENVEVTSTKSTSSKSSGNLCNQCRPADGSYGY